MRPKNPKPVKNKSPLYKPGTKWICNACGFKYNTAQRIRCRQCVKRKTGTEKTWRYNGDED